MKYVFVFTIVTIILQSCGGCLRNGGRAAVRNAADEKVLKQTDQVLTRDIEAPAPTPNRRVGEGVSHGSDMPVPHNPGRVLRDVTFTQQSFDFYLRNFFMDNPEWATSVEGRLARVEYMGSLDAGRKSVADLYSELNTMFDVSVCIHPGDQDPGISFSLGRNGSTLYEIEINSKDGFSVVAQTARTVEKGFLGAADLSIVHSPELRTLRPNQLKVNTQICFPLTDSELKLSTANGEVSMSPQSLSFKF